MARADRVAAAAFLWVFPFFFFYHSLAALDVMPPVLGNWWTASHALALIALMPAAVMHMSKHREVALHVPIVALTVLCAAVAGYNFLWGPDYARGSTALSYSLKMVVSWWGLYLLGVHTQASERLANFLFACCIGMVFVTPLLVHAEALDLYQYISQAVVFTALYVMAVRWNDRLGALSGGLALGAVIYLASRSELLGLVGLLIGWAMLVCLHRHFRLLAIMMAASVVSFGLITGSLRALDAAEEWRSAPQASVVQPGESIGQTSAQPEEPELPASGGFAVGNPIERQMELADVSESKSVQQRQELLESGWRAIVASPVTGDYFGQMRDHGQAGHYIHNALSMWRQFGLFAFIIYFGWSLAVVAVTVKKIVWDRTTEPVWILCGMVSGYTLLLIIAAKSVYWPMPALAWGLFIAAILAGRDTKRAAHRPQTR